MCICTHTQTHTTHTRHTLSPAFFKYVSISLYLFEYPLTCVKGVGSTISPIFSGGVSVSPGNSSSDMRSLVPRAREADAWAEGGPTATRGRNGANPDTDTTVAANSDAHSATCACGARAGRVIGRGPTRLPRNRTRPPCKSVLIAKKNKKWESNVYRESLEHLLQPSCTVVKIQEHGVVYLQFKSTPGPRHHGPRHRVLAGKPKWALKKGRRRQGAQAARFCSTAAGAGPGEAWSREFLALHTALRRPSSVQ